MFALKICHYHCYISKRITVFCLSTFHSKSTLRSPIEIEKTSISSHQSQVFFVGVHYGADAAVAAAAAKTTIHHGPSILRDTVRYMADIKYTVYTPVLCLLLLQRFAKRLMKCTKGARFKRRATMRVNQMAPGLCIVDDMYGTYVMIIIIIIITCLYTNITLSLYVGT